MGAVVNFSERGYSPAQMKLIKDMFVKGATDDQFNLFVTVCQRTGLDPFRREIYGIIRQVYNKETKGKDPQLTIVKGIDGFRRQSDETGTYAPDDREPRFTINPELVGPLNPCGIEDCTVILKKFHQLSGSWMPVVGYARWDEFAPISEEWAEDERTGKRKPTGQKVLSNDMWLKMPRNQLGKVAEAQAHRKGWPTVHSGIYEPAEMDRALAASEVLQEEDKSRRVKLTGGRDTVTFQFALGQPLEQVKIGQVHDRVDAWMKGQTDADKIKEFAAVNRESLRAFWAHDQNAALDLKAKMEERCGSLNTGAISHGK